uniref:CCHC-type domain-containing protein n=1 Tax=Pogona vitticeps TaxID=103695 RepID=A0ABM5EZV5_9SAUR
MEGEITEDICTRSLGWLQQQDKNIEPWLWRLSNCFSTAEQKFPLTPKTSESMEIKKATVELKDAPSPPLAASQFAAVPLPDVHSLKQKQLQLAPGPEVSCCPHGSDSSSHAPQLHFGGGSSGGGSLIHPGTGLDSQSTGTITCQIGSGLGYHSASSLKNVPARSSMAGVASDLSGVRLENSVSSCPHFPCCGKLHFQSCHSNLHKLHQFPTHQSCSTSGYFPCSECTSGATGLLEEQVTQTARTSCACTNSLHLKVAPSVCLKGSHYCTECLSKVDSEYEKSIEGFDLSIPLPKLINKEKFGLKTSSVLFGSGEAKTSGPSHIGAQTVGPPPQPTDAEKWMKRITEGQEALLKQLADQQRMLIEQIKTPPPSGTQEGSTQKQQIATRPPIKLQKMGPGDDPAAFLHTFERVATSAQWPKDQWALILTPYLTGLPQEIVDTLDPEEAGKYDVVRTAILNTLNLNEEAYRRKFRELKLKPGLHPRTLAQKLRVNATRWIQPKGKTAEQVLEIVVMEQLISTLSSGTRNWVVKNKPSDLEGAVKLLEDYLEAEETGQNRTAPQGERVRAREKMAEQSGQANAGGANPGLKKTRLDRIEYANPVGARVPRPTITSDPAGSKQAATWNLGKEKMTACFGCGQFGHIRKYCLVTECAWAEACTGMSKGPWARSEEERTALLEGGMCDTRIPGREVMLGVPSRPRASVGTQTAPKPFPPRMLHQAVDTMDLERGLKGLNISTPDSSSLGGKSGEGARGGSCRGSQ